MKTASNLLTMKTRILAMLLLLVVSGPGVPGAPVRDRHVEAELLAEMDAVVPGSTFTVALRLSHDEHWHTYWINDGDSGLPTEIKWELPDGFSAGPIVWPYPSRIPMPPLVSFGYEGEAWLLTEIKAPAELSADEITIKARVTWLMCKEACIPGKASLSLTLPVRPSASVARDFTPARLNIPATESPWRFSARSVADRIEITGTSTMQDLAVNAIDMFAVEKGVVANEPAVLLSHGPGRFVAALKRDEAAIEESGALRLVMVASPTLAADSRRPAIEVNVPFADAGAAGAEAAIPASPGSSLALILLFAFAGGMILNLMPCVFPVISLKIMGFVKQAGENPKVVWHHGLVFAAGVLVSFWLLAGILLALRAGGAGIGWGFQLQSPVVLVLLSLLFFTLSLNLFGVFEMGLSLTAAGGSVAHKQGWAGSFFSGFLATVIATPCTAPFMGVALGYALTQPPAISMLVFSSLAIGMAFPYLLLSRFPFLLKKLPRPGPWMETMKQMMGFFLLATVIWLVWVLSALVESGSLVRLLAGFLLVGLAAWIFGRWDTFARATPVRWGARLAALVIGTTGVWIPLQNLDQARAVDTAAAAGWETFSPSLLAEKRASGQPVFIDFTAKWCLTCQANKITVLQTTEMQDAFRANNVALLVADWTDKNEMIAAELARHGRQSVPLYLLYPADPEAEPVVLPELLTRKIVLDALQNLN